MFFGKLKKENEFLKRLVAVLLRRTYFCCDICVFGGTIPQSCEMTECKTCESKEKGTSVCCTCVSGCNFLWDGRDA